jgi:hypothetical protein
MTGGEIVPAAEMIAKGAAKALKNDPKTNDALLQAAKDTPHFKSAAVSVAKQQEIKQAIKLKIMQPLRHFVGASREYFESDFEVDLARKMEGVPEEQIQTPKTSIAMPALEALSYSVDEEELKEMYLTLLGRASDRRVSSLVHPSHSQIIRQLDVDEVGLLTATLRNQAHAIAKLTRKANNGGEGHSVVRQHLMNTYLNGEYWVAPESEVWVDNWVRLGLVEVDYISTLADARHYDWVANRPEMTLDSSAEDSSPPDIAKGYLRRTAFGSRFASAVIPKATTKSAIEIRPSLYVY